MVEDRWHVQLLGGLAASAPKVGSARFRTQKTAALLAYLAFHRTRTHPREVLLEVLWPDDPFHSARHKLNVALSSLRQQLNAPPFASVLRTDHFTVSLDPSRIATDVGDFEEALQQVRNGPETDRSARLQRAVSLYTGRLLPTCYEDWITPEAERLERLYLDALDGLIQELSRRGQLELAIDYALRWVTADPLSEVAHQSLMRLYGQRGQYEAAERQYELLGARLSAEGLPAPSPATRNLLQHLRAATPCSSAPAWASSRVEGEPVDAGPELPPAGGVLPLCSKLYIEREADDGFNAALSRKDRLILIKGPRQVGKTSLLARGLAAAAQTGWKVAFLDLQQFDEASFASPERLLRLFARSLGEQFEVATSLHDYWDDEDPPGLNLRRWLREAVLRCTSGPVLWALDEADRLAACAFGSDVMGMFRAWHNESAFDRTGLWERFALVLTYATEAHLLISDLHQSPFNVGTRLELEDFSRAQVEELNGRYGRPLRAGAELDRYYELVGGQPYLVQRGFHALATGQTTWSTLLANRHHDTGIFSDHLRRLLGLLHREPALAQATRSMLAGEGLPDLESFYRLRSAGIVSGTTVEAATFRCDLYRDSFQRHL